MDILIKATQFIMSLSILIVLHELGHFIPAKIFKTRVEKFYLFFDYKFSIFKKKIGETVYGIGWIPLGGYVKISGMIDESMDTEQMKLPPQPWEFRSKPAWQRLIIMLGGVTVNFILGIVIYIMIFFVWGSDFSTANDVKYGFSVDNEFKSLGFKDGDKILKINNEIPDDVLDVNKFLFLRPVQSIEVQHIDKTTEIISIPETIGKTMWEKGVLKPFNPRFTAVIDTIIADSPAQIAGLMKNDSVVSVNGKPIAFWNEFTDAVKNNTATQPLEISVFRNEELINVTVKPSEDNTIGVNTLVSVSEVVKFQHKEFSFGQSITEGSKMAYWTLHDFIAQFKYVFTKKGATSIGGFIAIGSIFPSTWSWAAFWSITAFLSIMLGFMNLLPIPALDGGHVVFTLFEMISGKKPSDKFLEYAQVAGFLLLISLLILANGNDIVKLFN
ncbi:MAG: RIP metalloprotease RseP [Flavobacteriaceae bacterium]|nr:RIP metalloprotease RseP [Flavobacteriaceae bacterium]